MISSYVVFPSNALMYLLTLASNNYFKLFQTRVESDFLRAGECIGKRKVKQNAAINNNKTPKESLPDAEFALEYEGENSAKYANRNSKKMRRFYKRLIFVGL